MTLTEEEAETVHKLEFSIAEAICDTAMKILEINTQSIVVLLGTKDYVTYRDAMMKNSATSTEDMDRLNLKCHPYFGVAGRCIPVEEDKTIPDGKMCIRIQRLPEDGEDGSRRDN